MQKPFHIVLAFSIATAACAGQAPRGLSPKPPIGIQVLDGETDNAVAGATVRVITGSSMFESASTTAEQRFRRELQAAWKDWRDPCSYFREGTEIGNSDAVGRAQLPWDCVFAEVQSGSKWAWASLAEVGDPRVATSTDPATPRKLYLREVREVSIKVEDAEGKAVAAAPVLLHAHLSRDDDHPDDLDWVGGSDAKGLITFKGVPLPVAGRDTLELRADTVCVGGPRDLDLKPVDSGTSATCLVLKAPPFASVEVQVKVADVDSTRSELIARLEPEWAAESGPVDEIVALHPSMRSIDVPVKDGVARFPCVGTAEPLVAVVYDLSGTRRPVRKRVDPLLEAGTTRIVELPAGSLMPVLSGTLVKADGTPAAAREIEAEIRTSGDSSVTRCGLWCAEAITDARGRFVFRLTIESAHAADKSIRLRVRSPDIGQGTRHDLVELPLPKLFEKLKDGEYDLGSFTVEATR